MNIQKKLTKSKKNSRINRISTELSVLSIDLKVENNEISQIWKEIIRKNPTYFKELLGNLGLLDGDFWKRNCIFCHKKLTFKTFFYHNASLGLGKAWDLWGNKDIEFYCLNCEEKHHEYH
jgi:hypothetical protein